MLKTGMYIDQEDNRYLSVNISVREIKEDKILARLGMDRDGFVWYPKNQIERMLTTGTYLFNEA